MTRVRSITATEFKAKCLNILDHVPTEGLAITKRGKTVAKLFPEAEGVLEFLGTVPSLYVGGDLLSTGEKWDAES